MGEQLKMFMTPDELIDQTNKMDSSFYDVLDQKAYQSPRNQWEHPKGGDPQVTGEEPFVHDRSLRQEKLDRIANDSQFGKTYESMPAVELRTYGWGSRRPVIVNGHHRLAWAEKNNVPYLAVTHSRVT